MVNNIYYLTKRSNKAKYIRLIKKNWQAIDKKKICITCT